MLLARTSVHEDEDTTTADDLGSKLKAASITSTECLHVWNVAVPRGSGSIGSVDVVCVRNFASGILR